MEEILRKLISYRTVSGDADAMRQLLDFVADYVTQRGMHVQRYEWNGYESLIATVLPGNKTPKVMLAAHADVVPADEPMFTMRTEDGKHIGRGVLDMKFAIAAYLQIINDIQNDLGRYDIGLMLTSDEEMGGDNGVAKLLDEGYLPQVFVLPDGGDNWQVQTGSKGILLYEISLVGKSAHGSRPWLGDNALLKLIAVLDEIAAMFPRHPQPDTSTISLTQMTGGQAPNQIPGTARMTIDVRAAGSEEYRRIASGINAICRQHDARCKLVSEGAPTSFSLKDPLIAPFVRHITDVTGIPVEGFYAPAASDARFVVPYGIPCILAYPTGGGHHGPEEWIDSIACQQFAVITRRYLDEVAKRPGTIDLQHTEALLTSV